MKFNNFAQGQTIRSNSSSPQDRVWTESFQNCVKTHQNTTKICYLVFISLNLIKDSCLNILLGSYGPYGPFVPSTKGLYDRGPFTREKVYKYAVILINGRVIQVNIFSLFFLSMLILHTVFLITVKGQCNNNLL